MKRQSEEEVVGTAGPEGGTEMAWGLSRGVESHSMAAGPGVERD